MEFYPRDYRDRRYYYQNQDAPIGAQISIHGTVISTEVQRTRGKLTILRCYLRDETGIMPAIWFNQPFLQKRFYPGRELIVFGKVERRFNTIELAVEDYQLAEDTDRAATGIVPIYSSSEGISQKLSVMLSPQLGDYVAMAPILPISVPQELLISIICSPGLQRSKKYISGRPRRHQTSTLQLIV